MLLLVNSEITAVVVIKVKDRPLREEFRMQGSAGVTFRIPVLRLRQSDCLACRLAGTATTANQVHCGSDVMTMVDYTPVTM